MNAEFLVKMAIASSDKALARVLAQDGNAVACDRAWEFGGQLKAAAAVQSVQPRSWNSNQAITSFLFKGWKLLPIPSVFKFLLHQQCSVII